MEDGDGPLVYLSAMLVQLIVVEGSVCSVVLVCFCLFLVFCKEDREEGFSSDHLAERGREREGDCAASSNLNSLWTGT